MFNFGLSELAVIAVVAVLVIGPKELPVVMAQLGRLFKRLSYMRFAVSQQFDGFLNQAGLSDVKDQVNFEVQPSAAESPAEAHKAAMDRARTQALEAEEKKALPKPKPKAKPKSKTTAKKTAKKTTAKKPTAKKKAPAKRKAKKAVSDE